MITPFNNFVSGGRLKRLLTRSIVRSLTAGSARGGASPKLLGTMTKSSSIEFAASVAYETDEEEELTVDIPRGEERGLIGSNETCKRRKRLSHGKWTKSSLEDMNGAAHQWGKQSSVREHCVRRK